MQVTTSVPPAENERQRSVNSFCRGSVIYTAFNCIGLFLNQVFNGQSIQHVLVYNAKNLPAMSHRSDTVSNASVNIATTSSQWASPERQKLLVLQVRQFVGCATVLIHNESIRPQYGQKWNEWDRYSILRMRVNGVSMVFVGGQDATQQQTVLHCSEMQFLTVCLFNMSLYTTSETYMQCLTGLIFFMLVALQSIFMKPCWTFQYCIF